MPETTTTKTKKRKPGRPPSPHGRARIQVRAFPAEQKKWAAKAKEAGLQLAEWIRASLNRAAVS